MTTKTEQYEKIEINSAWEGDSNNTLFLMRSGLPMLSPRTARSSASSLQASSRTLFAHKTK